MIRIFMIGFSSNKGGVETYITNLCTELDKNDFEVIYSMPEMLIDGKKWIRPRNRHNVIRYISFWKRFYKENHFDVVYYNTCDIVSIDQLKFAKAAGVPMRIIHSHNSSRPQEANRYLHHIHVHSEKKNRRELDQYATHFFACSQVAGDWMFGERKYEIIKNGISIPQYVFNVERREKIRCGRVNENTVMIGIIGRLATAKNPILACDIISEVSKKMDVRAFFIGDGELRGEVQRKIEDDHLEDIISLIGNVNNVNEWMSALDCLLLPSLFEGLPFVLVEAQAAGLPCVVSSAVSSEANITGTIEYIAPDAPLTEWCGAIQKACAGEKRQDHSLVLSNAGYSIEMTANKVQKIIKDYLKTEA